MIRKISLLLASLAVAAGLSLVAVAPAQATGNPVLDAKLYAGQAFDVQRGPAWPSCTDQGPFDLFSVSGMTDPYSSPTSSTSLGLNYLKLMPSGDPAHPWRLALFNPSDQELRYFEGSWVDSTDPNYGSAAKWNEGGDVYGLYESGYFFESSDRGNGTYVSLVTPYSNGGSTSYTPTSTYNDCVDHPDYGWVAMGKNSAIDPINYGGGGGGGGDGGGEPTPALDLALDLQVGAKFVGASSVISGSNLQPSSAYDLTMYSDPIVIYQGTTDSSGNFTETITIPSEVCVQGVHELILTGIDVNGGPVSDSKFVELGYNCEILQLSDTAIVATASMPDTGATVRTSIIVSTSAAVVFAFAFFVYASRRKLRFAWTNDRVASLMDDLDARLSGMEQRAKAAAARRKLRK